MKVKFFLLLLLLLPAGYGYAQTPSLICDPASPGMTAPCWAGPYNPTYSYVWYASTAIPFIRRCGLDDVDCVYHCPWGMSGYGFVSVEIYDDTSVLVYSGTARVCG